MTPVHFGEVTRVCGESQGYFGLPLHDYKNDNGENVMLSLWRPTRAEAAAIACGAPIAVHIIGCTPAPINLEVFE